MAQDAHLNRDGNADAFAPIAAHYDAIMAHVNYERWERIAAILAEGLPRPFRHLDAGCGTGVLLERLAASGWDSVGIDLSATMLAVARGERRLSVLARADLRALPFYEQFDLVTCLFDSMNFLLQEEHIYQALESLQQALRPGGVVYFDVVTKQMIKDHFNNEAWTENHGAFRSYWHSTFDRARQLCETRVRVNAGLASVTRERVYDSDLFRDAIDRAGLTLLAARDAHTWDKPRRRAARIDFIAVKGGGKDAIRRFQQADERIKAYVMAQGKRI